MPKVINIKI